MSNLTTVQYSELHCTPVIGMPALVTPYDHPSNLVSNTKPAITSPVTWIGKGGHVFHTKNSRYVPVLGSDELLNENSIKV